MKLNGETVIRASLNTQMLNMIQYNANVYVAIKIETESLIKTYEKRFANTYKFANYDINKFILLLQKGVHPYEYMDDWENLMRHHYQKKKIFTLKHGT